MDSHPYAAEEVLSFDRIKRAVTSRVVEVAEASLVRGAPLDRDKLAELTEKEWKSVKEAVRSSPAARERAREYMMRKTSEIMDTLISKDKAELEDLGVREKFL